MKNNLGIVISREYLTKVKKPSFIILTILMPFLMAAVVFVPVLFGMVKDDAKRVVGIADQTGKYEHLFVHPQDSDINFTFIPTPASSLAGQTDADFEAVVSITSDLAQTPEACTIYSHSEVPHDLQVYVEDILAEQIRQDKLKAYDVPQLEDIIEDVQTPFSIKTVKWSEDGSETESSGEIAQVLGLLTAMLIYMFVMCYGAMVMQSVMEEKTNRIVEVIVGSVKPFQLMLGKIVAVMLVGFTQIAIWGVMLFGIITGAGLLLSKDIDPSAMQTANLTSTSQQMAALSDSPVGELLTVLSALPLFEIGVLFVLYFLGGYILYSSFYAAIGASVNSQEDSSQFMMPMVIIMIIALYGAMGSMDNTDGPLAFWASLFPLTSPIVMMVRIPFGVPLWQEILSVGLLYATAFAFVWLGGRIYRVGILMYGKKPTFRELAKWMTYKD